MVCILCQQQLLHLSTVLLMKWLPFTFGTSVWQIGGICCLITWTFLINEAGLSSCGACPGKRTHLVHTQSWARLKNLKACQHGLALLPRCPCSSLGQDLSSLFAEQLCLAMSEFPAVSWVYRHLNHILLPPVSWPWRAHLRFSGPGCASFRDRALWTLWGDTEEARSIEPGSIL